MSTTPFPSSANPCPRHPHAGHHKKATYRVQGVLTELCVQCLYEREKLTRFPETMDFEQRRQFIIDTFNPSPL